MLIMLLRVFLSLSTQLLDAPAPSFCGFRCFLPILVGMELSLRNAFADWISLTLHGPCGSL